MIGYAARRLVAAVFVILIVMAFLSVMDRLIPGNPVTYIFGPRASPALVAQVRRQMGLDVSVPVQIYQYIFGAVHGNLGVDFVTNQPVSSLVMENLPYTVVLAVSGLALAVVVGVPLGILASTRPGGFVDRVIGIVSVSVITMPSFVVGLLLILVFAVHLHLLPVIGAGAPGDPVDDLRHLVLPASALAIGWIGYLARLVRSNMLEVLTANYVRTAHAFGVRREQGVLQVPAEERRRPGRGRPRGGPRQLVGGSRLHRGDLRPSGPRHARLQRHLLVELSHHSGHSPRYRRDGHMCEPACRLLLPTFGQPHPSRPVGQGLKGAS